jgi:hypothetical protein
MGSPAMTCAEAEPLLPLVADGAVDPDSDPALFAHLAGCPACQEAVARHDLIALAIARGAGQAAPRIRRPVLRWWLPAAAAALVAAAAGWWLVRPETPAAITPVAAITPAAPETAATGPATPTVLRIQQPDGSQVFLIREHGRWMVVGHGTVDGPADASHPVLGAQPVGARF